MRRITGPMALVFLKNASRDYAVADIEYEGGIRTEAPHEALRSLERCALLYAMASRDDEASSHGLDPLLTDPRVFNFALLDLVNILVADVGPSKDPAALEGVRELTDNLHDLELKAMRAATFLAETAAGLDEDPNRGILDIRQLAEVLRGCARRLLVTAKSDTLPPPRPVSDPPSETASEIREADNAFFGSGTSNAPQS